MHDIVPATLNSHRRKEECFIGMAVMDHNFLPVCEAHERKRESKIAIIISVFIFAPLSKMVSEFFRPLLITKTSNKWHQKKFSIFWATRPTTY